MDDNDWLDGSIFVDAGMIDPEDHEWGARKTLVNAAAIADAEMTFALVWVMPGMEDPMHTHPNCEQVVHVLAGECDFQVGDTVYTLTMGDTIRVPRGVPHTAACTSWEPLRLLVAQSSPRPETRMVEPSAG